MASNAQLVDRLGRRVSTVRISLTDRCNFRCAYCMPPEGVPLEPRPEYLTIDELERVVRLTGQLGVTRYRLTGGEPLLRPDIVTIVERLSAIDTVKELSATTNASLLQRLAAPLRKAGLNRINVSLDSLDSERFSIVTRSKMYQRVRDGIEAAIDAGFPLKINVVVMAGMTPREIVDFARMAEKRSLEIRFLEFMPLCGSGWGAERVLPINRVRGIIQEHFELSELPRTDQPAQTFAISRSGGRVGFIAPLSEPFCRNCSRIRITAAGRIRPCLFSHVEFDLGPLVRGGASDKHVIAAIREAVWNKPAGSEFNETPFHPGESERRSTTGPLIRNIGG